MFGKILTAKFSSKIVLFENENCRKNLNKNLKIFWEGIGKNF